MTDLRCRVWPWITGLLWLGAASTAGAGKPPVVALNHSSTTTCAEEDNVNVPLTAPRQVRKVTVTASHPRYGFETDNCQPDFSGCDLARMAEDEPKPVTSFTIFDDGVNVFRVCSDPGWWRPYAMTVTAGGGICPGHFLVWACKIRDEASWPECAVLYQDGNLRLKPHPPKGRSDCCYGSSVLVGPAPVAERPCADVERIDVDVRKGVWQVTYRQGGTAALRLKVDRKRAVVKISVGYATDVHPFATFRSMWVADGHADVDSIGTRSGVFPILGSWDELAGPKWFFHRQTASDHNTSAPDIAVSAQ
ncbi:MAG: hypothetical protein JXR77_05260 [Lentisphaeria bacterium]|nr:hypothetical protein [Lentisphaeria bacterium]